MSNFHQFAITGLEPVFSEHESNELPNYSILQSF